MVSRDTAEQAAKDAGLPPEAGRRRSSTTTATPRSTRSSGRCWRPSLFALVAFWLAGDLPGAPLVAPAAPRAPPRAEPADLDAALGLHASRVDGLDERAVVALVLVGVGLGEIAPTRGRTCRSRPRYAAMATRSPERAWARASVQPHSWP